MKNNVNRKLEMNKTIKQLTSQNTCSKNSKFKVKDEKEKKGNKQNLHFENEIKWLLHHLISVRGK